MTTTETTQKEKTKGLRVQSQPTCFIYKFEASQGPHIKTLSQNKQINNQTNKILNEKSQGSGTVRQALQSHLCYLSASCLGSLPPPQTGSRVTMTKGMMDINHSYFFICKYCARHSIRFTAVIKRVLVSQGWDFCQTTRKISKQINKCL